ncbi:MAG: hypothetical protein MZU97_08340 [Bacillus subtilis]|nr:hypothetical protein [Bacillus subtilis]
MWETKAKTSSMIVSSICFNPISAASSGGKAGSPYEFGPKVALSKVNGFVHIDEISFDNFNEAKRLSIVANRYKELHGVYPQSAFVPTRSTKPGRTRSSARDSASVCPANRWEDRRTNRIKRAKNYARRLRRSDWKSKASSAS